jgi:broad specificity phosphatase PhoE
MKPLAKPTILFVRHAEIADNKEKRLPGWQDQPLDAHGEAEAQKTAAKVAEFPVKHIYTSPLKRSAKTAQIIAKKIGVSVTPTNGLLPWNYGEIAGKPDNEENRAKLDALQKNPETKAPGGESFADYADRRFFPTVAKMREYVKKNPSHALVASTHSRNLLALKHALGDKSKPVPVDKHAFPNASIWKAEFSDNYPNGFKLTEVN